MVTSSCVQQLASHLRQAEEKKPSSKKKGLVESEYLDVIEDVCENAWEK